MALIDKTLAQVSEADLLELITDQRAEDKTIDYKQDLPGGTDADRKEFLHDITSFANTEGGHLIFGMEEDAGLPSKLAGLGTIDADAVILALEQSLRTGVKPPLTIESRAVPLAAGGVALVMRIPKSWNPPHQVTYKGTSRFYARASAGKYEMDVNDLRAVFLLSSTIAERMRDFRVDRIAKIVADDGPVPQLDGGTLMIHVLPLSAFGPSPSFPITKIHPNEFPTIDDNAPLRAEITFDGMLMTSNAHEPPAPQRAYVMVSRTGGTVEAVHSSIARVDKSIDRYLVLEWLEPRIIRSVRLYVQALAKHGVEPPIAITVGLSGVKGLRFIAMVPPNTFTLADLPSVIVTRDQFFPIETVLDRIPTGDRDAAAMLRPTLDHIANAFGLQASPFFDTLGAYSGRLQP